MLPFEQKLHDEFGYTVQVACEIEFYISSGFSERSKDNEFLAEILLALSKKNIAVSSIGLEVAPNQFEVALTPKSPEIAIFEVTQLKGIAANICAKYGQEILFSAKPFENLPGSGLHIHISLFDSSGNALYSRDDDKNESSVMLYSIGGLCQTMLKNFIYFAPDETSYQRFSSVINNIAEYQNPMVSHNNAPVNVSWGGNNRTTAIRIPTSTINEQGRHIEFRVAGADADPKHVIEKIIEGIYFGISNKINPPEKIYGNAYDAQYNFLTRFPLSLEEAKKL